MTETPVESSPGQRAALIDQSFPPFPQLFNEWAQMNWRAVVDDHAPPAEARRSHTTPPQGLDYEKATGPDVWELKKTHSELIFPDFFSRRILQNPSLYTPVVRMIDMDQLIPLTP